MSNEIFDEAVTPTERMTICTACEEFLPDFSGCAKCACFMEEKVKMPLAVCPIGKW